MARLTVAELAERVAELEGRALTHDEVKLVRQQLRVQVVRAEHREVWSQRWRRWTARQRIAAILGVAVGLVTAANQLAGFIHNIATSGVRP